MGNIFSIDLSSLITRCCDCAAAKAVYVYKLEDNLKTLQTARKELDVLKKDVVGKIEDAEGPEMKRLATVEQWRLEVEATLNGVNDLIEAGPEEIKKLCLGGYCSKNYKSSYGFGKSVAKKLKEVDDLKSRGAFESVVKRVLSEPLYIRQAKHDLGLLKTEKEDLKALKEDVMGKVKVEGERQKKPLKQVQVWFSMVDDIITDADDLMRNSQDEIDKLCVGGSNSNFGDRVSKILKDVIALKDKGDFEVVAERAPVDPVIKRNCARTVGMETNLQKVWSCLLEQGMRVIGIYGIGGVGKTTLLTKINNEFLKMPHDFDTVIWVTVSKDLRLEKIQEDIWIRLGCSVDEGWKKKSMVERAEAIFNVLCNKKFVLLLDDMWEEVDLEKVGIPLQETNNRSKIVFTTRSEEVCGRMRAAKKFEVWPLEWKEAWQLFLETFGEEIGEEIQQRAQEVAKECGGLPISLKTVARAMACQRTPQEWNYALEKLKMAGSSLRDVEKKVFERLKFSYDYLPDDTNVKPCFLYCALFPEDFKISKDALIDYWICENYCRYGEGYYTVGTLVRACLLEEVDGKYVKMHDVIRDMALWITSKHEKENEKFLVRAGVQLQEAPEVVEWEGVKRISLMNNEMSGLKKVPTCRNLSTLLLGGNKELTITSGFFQYMDSLAVLDLSGTRPSHEILVELSKLVSLQYLDLSSTGIEGLPPEFKKLDKLKYLNLENNPNLKMIPLKVIASLSSLQVLMMYNWGRKHEEMELDGTIWSGENMLVEELNLLNCLRTLTITRRGKMSSVLNFFNTSKFWSCTRQLGITDFRGSASLNISFLASMKHLETMEILRAYNLKNLVANSVMEGRYSTLQCVVLRECSHLLDLTWLIIMSPNLTELNIGHCQGMRELVSAEKSSEILAVGESLTPFAKLRVLQLERLASMESIYRDPLPFPLLERVRVLDCPELKRLPLNSNSAKGCQVIEGSKDWWDNLEWHDDATKDYFSRSFKDNSEKEWEAFIQRLSPFSRLRARMGRKEEIEDQNEVHVNLHGSK